MKKTTAILIMLLITVSSITAQTFTIEPLPLSVIIRMKGLSYPAAAESRVALNNLRYLKISHYDINGNVHVGEMVVSKDIAQDAIAIFKDLYNIKYPIERMELIDNYQADDEKSMRANNTSGFCFRLVKGSAKLSAHSRGCAIDINPLYNPCLKVAQNAKGYKEGTLQPQNAQPYVDRSKQFPYKITQQVINIFKKHGFRWGGNWRTVKDYQHFEK